ncbi:MAG TPA: GNAT family N-acetyltransferase [Spirochaetia bacterium]|nr:GNAT family N-acetyltransferase [Spirochaetia bacterium]
MLTDNISSFLRINSNFQFKSFDCGDEDLNDFLLNDSQKYYDNLLAVTYILENTKETVAFFSVLNDKISISDSPSKSFWKEKVSKKLPFTKRYDSYPAVKIGRLGINKNYQGKGIGTAILDYVKTLFITNNRTGCKFITVDGYNNPKTLDFYIKNGFNYLLSNKKSDEEPTKLLYFDLAIIKNSLNDNKIE